MVRENEIRTGEASIDAPLATDAGLVFISLIRTPWTDHTAAAGRFRDGLRRVAQRDWKPTTNLRRVFEGRTVEARKRSFCQIAA
jgi:hypothetical protein